MNPFWLTLTFVWSRPGISEFGRRPTDISTRSKTCSFSFTFGQSRVTRMPVFSSLSDFTVVLSRIAEKSFSSRLCRGRTRSRSAPGILLDYSSVTNSRIVFAGGGFAFVGPTTNVQFQIDDVVGGFGDSIGFYGYFSSTSPYTIGTITTNGSIQTAPVAGSGILHISDGTQEYTGTIQWLDITTLGTSGVLNLNGQVNLTVIGYPGASLNLLALAASLTAQVDLTFQFIPARTLTDLKATGGFTDFDLGGRRIIK